MRRLGVYYLGQTVGELVESQADSLEFTYSEEWLESKTAFSISNSLPRSSELYKERAHYFFANLLPEGTVRDHLARKLGISVDNDFSFLKAIGGECAGSLVLSEIPPAEKGGDTYQDLTIEDLKKLLHEGRPILPEFSGELRLSLAGAQDKLPVLWRNGELSVPHGASSSSHILKFPNKDYKHLPENECLITWLAREVGLPVMDIELLNVDGVFCSLMERYDRKGHDEIQRIHQEDMCQALGYSQKKKYQREGGPSISQVISFIEDNSVNLPKDTERILEWLIFCVLVGNCDNHSKNLSLIMKKKDLWQLTPFYDLVCTRVFPSITTKLGFTIGGSEDSGTVAGAHWDRFAKEISVGKSYLRGKVEGLLERIPVKFGEVSEQFQAQYGKSPAVEMVHKVLNVQCRRIQKGLD